MTRIKRERLWLFNRKYTSSLVSAERGRERIRCGKHVLNLKQHGMLKRSDPGIGMQNITQSEGAGGNEVLTPCFLRLHHTLYGGTTVIFLKLYFDSIFVDVLVWGNCCNPAERYDITSCDFRPIKIENAYTPGTLLINYGCLTTNYLPPNKCKLCWKNCGHSSFGPLRKCL